MVRLTPEQAEKLFANKKPKETRKGSTRKQRDQLPENKVEAQIVGYLRVLGWRVARRQSGRFRCLSHPGVVTIGEPGEADYECLRPLVGGWLPNQNSGKCHHFFLEIKAPGKKPDDNQLLFGRRMQVQGFIWVWFDSLEGFKDWYRKQTYGSI
jgi:hypothetical protein